MAKPGVLLIEQSSGWLFMGLGRHSVSRLCVVQDPAELAKSAIAFCQEHSLDPSRAILTVATDSVFVTKIPLEVLAKLKTKDSLRYHLESCLPFDAESLVAELLITSPRSPLPDAPLALALDANRFEPLLEPLELQGIQVQAIVPWTILVLQQALRDQILRNPSVTVWPEGSQNALSSESDRVGLVRLNRAGQLTEWQLMERSESSLSTVFGLWEIEPSQAIWMDDEDVPELASAASSTMLGKRIRFQPKALACKAAATILDRRAKPWIDLRLDRLSSSQPFRRVAASLRSLVYAALVCLALIGCLLGWLSFQYKKDLDRFEQQQRDVFASTFPNQSIPAGLMTRLRSELAKSKAVRSTDQSVDASKRALPILHLAMSGIPKELPLELNEVRIENGRVVLEFLMSDQKDVGMVVSALARAGFDVEPPATSLIDGVKIQTTVLAELKKMASK
jgi:hypothetical protein